MPDGETLERVGEVPARVNRLQLRRERAKRPNRQFSELRPILSPMVRFLNGRRITKHICGRPLLRVN